MLRSLRLGFLAAALGFMSLGPAAMAVSTPGTVNLTATINNVTTNSGTNHYTLVWVTGPSGFVKTLWKQGPSSFTNSEYTKHCNAWVTAKAGSVAFDGYTSATANAGYAATNPSPPVGTTPRASNPINVNWNCMDATNSAVVPDGTYNFFIQYAEDSGTVQGPVTSALSWTKGPTQNSPATTPFANQGTLYSPTGGFNFTSISVTWTPSATTTAPTITSAAPPGSGAVGTAYNHTVTANGTAPITFTVSAGALPGGLSLSTAGVISGTPTTTGTFTGTIQAANGTLPNATQNFSIVISGAAVSTPGTANLSVTLTSLGINEHDTVVWVTKADGTFIKTLWKQGDSDFGGADWVDHFDTWNNARNGSTALDGFTSATAMTYSPPNNPITLTWNGLDASNQLLPDGIYKFWVQYADSLSGEGPFTPNGLAWTKGATASSVTPANQVPNFTNMSIVWTPSVTATAPTITSTAPASTGVVGTAYNHTVTATGTTPITFTVSAGALPTGLTLSTAGAITGSPSVTGTFTGTIQAANGTAPNATQDFSIVITQAPAFTSAAPPATGVIGVAYNHDCTASGTTPITFTVSAGALPTGLTLSTAGAITGNPSVTGTFTGTIQAANGTAPNATQNFSIVITQAPAFTSAAPPATGVIGVAYNHTCTASGTTPITFTVSAGALPTGLTLSTTGAITGSPSVTGTFTGTIQAANGTAPNATQNFSIVIGAAPVPPTFTSVAPPATGVIGVAYNHTCTASGTTPITFTVSSGALPTGLTLSTAGAITGSPSVTGTFTGTIQAANGTAPNATQNFSIIITQAPAFTSAAPPATGTTGIAYNHACTASGTAPVTFTVTSGNLPTGLTMNSAGVISGTPTAVGTFTGTITAANGTLPDATQNFSITIGAPLVFTPGTASLQVTLTQMFAGEHDAVVWVTKADGTFIKTLWKQGDPDFAGADWLDHFNTWNTARNGSTAFDGYTSPTAMDYNAPNSPIILSWNGRDASNNIVPDGTYKFWVQYAEQDNDQGPVTTGGLTWTKGATATSVTPANQAPNFSNMSIVWTPKSPGLVSLTTTLSDYTGSTSATTGKNHYTVVWVTKADGTFIKTVWRQGPADFAHKDWTDHFVAYNTARAGSTLVDGYTSATATTYLAPNSPITPTWDCKDASGNLMPDGDYQFWIQYGESKTVSGVPEQGPATTGLTWTKGPASSTVNLPDQGTFGTPANGFNFSTIQIVWTAGTVPPAFTSAAPPLTGTMGTAYSHACTTSGSAPISYSVTSGALPTGLTLNGLTGVISGIPTVAGPFTGTITATNGVAPDATQAFSITIGQAIVFTSAPPPANGNVVSPYTHSCTVIGTAPVTFTVTAGALPTGLSLSSGGVISGTPTTIGTFTGTITAANGGLATPATQNFSIVISAATAGSVSLIATISDYAGATGTATSHDTVAWVTKADGTFIKTLWKQGPADFNHKDWTDHFAAYTTARAGSTAIDGYTGATAANYSAAANNPLTVTWNCRDTSNNLVDDGTYNFYIQYGESQSGVQGPLTTALAWTKGTSPSAITPAAQGTQGTPALGNNFTNMVITWTPGTANTPPTFSGYAIGTPYQTAATIGLGKIMTNAADANGDGITCTIPSGASTAGGTVVLQASSILYTPPTVFSGADTFRVTITDARGAATIGTVTVTVGLAPTAGDGNPVGNPPKLTVLPGGNVDLKFQGIPFQSYQIQRSADLLTWTTITTVAANNVGTVTFTDVSPPAGAGFYRLALP